MGQIKKLNLNMKIGTKLILSFGILLTLLVIVGVVVLINTNDMENQFEFVVTHDALVISNAHLLFKLVVDMETGQRGFIITQKEEFLEPYYDGAEEFDRIIIEEKLLVADNPEQVARLERIEQLVEEWKTIAAIPEIELARKVAKHNIDASYLQSVLGRGVGKGLMDKIRSVLSEMNDNFRSEGNKDSQILAIAVEKDMVDMETGQRGFLATGKESFLEPYHAGEKQLKIDFSDLRNILSDDQTNLKLLDEALSISDDWIIMAATPEIDARLQMNKDPETMKDVSSLLEVGTGKNILDQLKEEFAQFIQIEEDLTTSRHANATEAASTTRTLTIGVVLLSILIGSIVATLIRQSILLQVGGEPSVIALLSEQVASGNLDVDIEKGTGILGSIKVMLDSLKQNRDHLQKLVDERTKDLNNEIIEHKRSEDEKNKLQEQLVQSERMESLGLLAGGVAHDLNNIIGPIMAYPDLIRMDLAEGKSIDQDLDVITASAQRAADVIGDLLALTRRGKYEMEPIDLNDLVADYLSSAECKMTKTLYPEVSLDIQLSESTLLFKGS